MSYPVPVWQAKLDDRYECRVQRLTGVKGRLTVKDEKFGAILLDEEVGLAYGALYGPDIVDLQDWQEKCMKAVDDNQGAGLA